MAPSKLLNQVLSVLIQNHPLNLHFPASSAPSFTPQLVIDVLRSIPRFFFQSPRSIGRQLGFRHRSPIRQRSLRLETLKSRRNVLVLGPASHRDPKKLRLGLHKALEFYHWVQSHHGFAHTHLTCSEMAIVLAKSNALPHLWNFLKETSTRALVTTSTLTCLIKVLGEQGLAKEALSIFYRMKQFHCKRDVCAYNTVLHALCRVGYFKKARLLLDQMELPGFRFPPDIYTYTILISCYCKHGLQTGCRKATRRRIWEANRLFRILLFRGFVPDVVTYNCLIDGCCKTYRISRALELFEDMIQRGCIPNRATYNSFIRYFAAVNEVDRAVEMLRMMEKLNHGTPTSSSYTPIIHALCEAGRAHDARELLVELVGGGSIPREYTYTLVYNAIGSSEGKDDELRRRIERGIKDRYRDVMKVKPIMMRNSSLREEWDFLFRPSRTESP